MWPLLLLAFAGLLSNTGLASPRILWSSVSSSQCQFILGSWTPTLRISFQSGFVLQSRSLPHDIPLPTGVILDIPFPGNQHLLTRFLSLPVSSCWFHDSRLVSHLWSTVTTSIFGALFTFRLYLCRLVFLFESFQFFRAPISYWPVSDFLASVTHFILDIFDFRFWKNDLLFNLLRTRWKNANLERNHAITLAI